MYQGVQKQTSQHHERVEEDTNDIRRPIYYKIYLTPEAVPKCYGLPKIHKNNIAASKTESVKCRQYNLQHGQILSHGSKLSPLVRRTEQFVKNNSQFV